MASLTINFVKNSNSDCGEVRPGVISYDEDFIECDLEYPKELHYLHNDYPLAPEKLIVQDDWLSLFWNTQKNYIIYIMITPLPLKN